MADHQSLVEGPPAKRQKISSPNDSSGKTSVDFKWKRCVLDEVCNDKAYRMI